LACNETTKLPEPALLVCKSIPLVEGESIGKIMIIGHRMNSVGLFILKTMIIGHRMKLFILMPGGSGLPSMDTAKRKKYVMRILLAAVLEE
jgi:hypothetical protein